MNTVLADPEQPNSATLDFSEDVIELGCVTDTTRGAQFGWKLEPGINPYYI